MGFFWQSQGKSETSSDLLFENVEALAVEENWENGSDCQGSGSVVCPYTDDKVYMVDFYSLWKH